MKIVLNCVTFHIAKVHWPVENFDVPPLPKVWSKVLILCYAVNLMAPLLSKEISTLPQATIEDYLVKRGFYADDWVLPASL